MNTETHKNTENADAPNTPNDPIVQKEVGKGLTDDERVSREAESEGEGARVELGPADLDRLPKN